MPDEMSPMVLQKYTIAAKTSSMSVTAWLAINLICIAMQHQARSCLAQRACREPSRPAACLAYIATCTAWPPPAILGLLSAWCYLAAERACLHAIVDTRSTSATDSEKFHTRSGISRMGEFLDACLDVEENSIEAGKAQGRR